MTPCPHTPCPCPLRTQLQCTVATSLYPLAISHTSLGCKSYTTPMGGNGCVGVFPAPPIIQRCCFKQPVYLWSYSWLAHLDQPSFTRDLVQALSTWNSLFFSFVRVVLFSSKLTTVAYPNPSRAKDKILTEALLQAVDGGTNMGGS